MTVRQRLFTEGSHVKRGHPLYRIEDATHRADVATRQAALARVRATLESARLNARRTSELAKVNGREAGRRERDRRAAPGGGRSEVGRSASGQQALEIDFLAGALNKAGSLSPGRQSTATYRKPNTSKKHRRRPMFPYLLRGLAIERVRCLGEIQPRLLLA